MAARIAQLQEPHVDDIERGAGNGANGHARALHGDRPRQAPVGDMDTHAALNELDLFKVFHQIICLWPRGR